MTDATEGATPGSTAIARNWIWILLLGVVLVAGGVAALSAPFVASVAVSLWIGVAFLCAGAAQLLQSLQAKGWRGAVWHIASGAIYVLGGLLVVFRPLEGLVVITTLIVATLFVSGLLRLFAGLFMVRPEPGWGWITAGGVVAVAAAALIWLSFPGATLVLLGVLAGVAFITEGWGMIMLGLAARKMR